MDLHREWKVLLSHRRKQYKEATVHPTLRRQIMFEIIELCRELQQMEREMMALISDTSSLRSILAKVVVVQKNI